MDATNMLALAARLDGYAELANFCTTRHLIRDFTEAAHAIRSLAATDGAVVGWGVFGNGGLIDTLNSEEDAKAFAKFHFGEPHPDVEVSALYRAPPSPRYAEGCAAGIEAAAELEAIAGLINYENIHYMARVGGLSVWCERLQDRLRALKQGGNDV